MCRSWVSPWLIVLAHEPSMGLAMGLPRVTHGFIALTHGLMGLPWVYSTGPWVAHGFIGGPWAAHVTLMGLP